MFRKYEKTYRIIVPQINIHGKYFLSDSDTKLLLGGKVTVSEKLDGANIGIVRHKDTFRLQKRGSLVGQSEHEQFNFFRDWSFRNTEKIMSLPKNIVLYGELLRCVHTIHYDRLPDWVCFYAVWHNQYNEYLPWDDVSGIVSEAGLHTVPYICEGHINKDELFDLIPQTSQYGSEKAEGIVVWNYRQQLRGKVVREEFVKNMEEDEHWSNKMMTFNEVIQS